MAEIEINENPESENPDSEEILEDKSVAVTDDFSHHEDNSVHVHVEIPESEPKLEENSESEKEDILNDLPAILKKIEDSLYLLNEKIDKVKEIQSPIDTILEPETELDSEVDESEIEQKFEIAPKRKWSIYR